ncbi:MAG: hypothetical protein BGO99_13135 [Nitrosospira sp. 56-18]|jgi:hypothetical protein|nr:hypothetical protein [Nitrosospira sp.]OJY14497.1 MAG: hypothetical protein BGO99_13135 [Nitrosospira sp. 56-18]
MDIWPKNYDTLKVLHIDDEASTEETVRITIELLNPSSSETVEIDREEGEKIIEHLKRVFSIG